MEEKEDKVPADWEIEEAEHQSGEVGGRWGNGGVK